MHDPEERPRLRWRMLLWPILGVILLPVLYVAASGPLWWWLSYHPLDRPRFGSYTDSLLPLYRTSQSTDMYSGYLRLWSRLPAPRSWHREVRVQMIAMCKENLEIARADRSQLEAEATRLHARLRELSVLSEPLHVRGEEAAMIELRLNDIERELHFEGPGFLTVRVRITRGEQIVRQSEQRLRDFDAQ